MTEPRDVPPDTAAVPAPFEPLEPGRADRGSGCAKVAVIGCLGVLVALGIGMVIVFTQAPKIMRWVFENSVEQIEPRYTAEVTPADRERVRAAFTAAGKAVEEKRIDPLAMQRVQSQIMTLVRSQAPVDREQALRLAEALEELAASKPPAGGGG
jgi:hypothetical protein